MQFVFEGNQIRWEGEGVIVEATPAATTDGRVRFVDLRIRTAPGGNFVSSDALRSVPVTQMLTWANTGRVHELILQMAGFAAAPSPEVPRRKPPLQLEMPPGARKPDVFYERVARAYTWLVVNEGSRRPAVDIAQANKVPATTAHRWIREARRRGLLQSGVAGRAGA